MKEVDCIGCLHYAACKNLMQHMSYTPTKCSNYKNGNNLCADDGKKDMSLTTALIILNNLNTTERVDVDRGELMAAIKAVKPAVRKQIPLPLVTLKGRATDSSGNEIIVKQPCCPICGEAILNAQQRQINYCPSCGQAIQIERETEERN